TLFKRNPPSNFTSLCGHSSLYLFISVRNHRLHKSTLEKNFIIITYPSFSLKDRKNPIMAAIAATKKDMFTPWMIPSMSPPGIAAVDIMVTKTAVPIDPGNLAECIVYRCTVRNKVIRQLVQCQGCHRHHHHSNCNHSKTIHCC